MDWSRIKDDMNGTFHLTVSENRRMASTPVSAESADHDSICRMPRISSRMRFGELWLSELRCPLWR